MKQFTPAQNVEQKKDVIKELGNWYLDIKEVDSGKLNIDGNTMDVNKWICIVGETGNSIIKTGVICKALSEKLVQTQRTKYFLSGTCKIDNHTNILGEELSLKLKQGFYANWSKDVYDFLCTRQKVVKNKICVDELLETKEEPICVENIKVDEKFEKNEIKTENTNDAIAKEEDKIDEVKENTKPVVKKARLINKKVLMMRKGALKNKADVSARKVESVKPENIKPEEHKVSKTKTLDEINKEEKSFIEDT